MQGGASRMCMFCLYVCSMEARPSRQRAEAALDMTRISIGGALPLYNVQLHQY